MSGELIIAGIFTGIESLNVEKNLPTPWIGVWERIIIADYMLWIVVLAILLTKRNMRAVNKN